MMQSMCTDSKSEIACSCPGAAIVLMSCESLEHVPAKNCKTGLDNLDSVLQ